MNKIFFIVFCCMLRCGLVAAQSPAVYDGPYVLYEADRIVLRGVTHDMPNRVDISLGYKPMMDVPVNFPENASWNFSVKLKPQILVEKCEYAQPEKLFFISDIEGEFAGFRALLISNKIIDEKYNWTFGKGHMVVCGDLFDRGMEVPQCMWLLYKLEQDAKKAGGYVHTILGNHDVMNLSGDLRYVQPKYFEAAKMMELDYMSLYGPKTELGRWLRSKNTIEKIGDNLCAHAGIAPQINKLGMSLQEINNKCRPYYDRAKVLKGVGDPAIDAFFTGETSLFWYRGYFHEPKATEAEVDETLQLYKVKRIVVGHTIVPGNVGFYYGGKVLGLDVNQHAHDHQAALFENGKWFKVNDSGNKTVLYEQTSGNN